MQPRPHRPTDMPDMNPNRLILFSSRQYDADTFTQAKEVFGVELDFQEAHLNAETAILARGFAAVCPFVNDVVDAAVLHALHQGSTRLIALRSAGFNHVDLHAAKRLGIAVTRVPAYSPHAVAKHAVGMILTLTRRGAHARRRHLAQWPARLRSARQDRRRDRHGHHRARVRQHHGGLRHAAAMLRSRQARRRPARELRHRVAALSATYHLIDGRALARMKRGAMLNQHRTRRAGRKPRTGRRAQERASWAISDSTYMRKKAACSSKTIRTICCRTMCSRAC